VRLSVRNRTNYRFDRPVSLETHVIRLRPRLDAHLSATVVALEVAPSPSMRSEYLDLEGNAVTQVWFKEPTDHLRIDCRARVETLCEDPFRFLLDHPKLTLPDPYPEGWRGRLANHLRTDGPAPESVSQLAAEIARQCGQRPEAFPGLLSSWIHRECPVEIRPTGPSNPAERTLTTRRGACRDLAVLFNECCRSVGLAARFVSGYMHVDDSDGHDLHAWSEIYLPGGGWRGYDPTHGLAVSDRHVPVAAAADPADAAPVSGSYRGSAGSTLETSVEITEDA